MLRMLRAALRMPWRCGKRCKASTAGGGANVFLWRKQCRECGAKQPLRNYCWMCLSQIWINLDYHNVRSVWINYDQLNKVWTSQKLYKWNFYVLYQQVCCCFTTLKNVWVSRKNRISSRKTMICYKRSGVRPGKNGDGNPQPSWLWRDMVMCHGSKPMEFCGEPRNGWDLWMFIPTLWGSPRNRW
jgi:hypothetical protein